MTRIELAIFDLDGVLTSTTYEHFHAWELLFVKYFGIEIDPSLEKYTKGVSRAESFNVICQRYGINMSDIEKEVLMDEKNTMYQKLIQNFNSSKCMAGSVHMLDYLKSKNVKIALGSASKNGELLIKRIGLQHYFDYVVDPTYLASKPAPDIFRQAQLYFGLESNQCIGIEDAISGIKAIKAANMFAIGIGPENLVDADIHVETLPQITDEILDQILEGKYANEHREF